MGPKATGGKPVVPSPSMTIYHGNGTLVGGAGRSGEEGGEVGGCGGGGFGWGFAGDGGLSLRGGCGVWGV